MYPFSIPICFGDGNAGRVTKFVFVLFVLGVFIFCAGILLSIFGFQACQVEGFHECSMTLKVLGPSLAALGLGSILIAKSRARLYLRQRQLQGDQEENDSFFLCGENNQFAQFLIFGFLFLASGLLISVLGMWVPGCSTGSQHQQGNNSTAPNIELRSCGLLSLQIMGPLIVLVGLCFFVVAHIKKKHVPTPSEEASLEEEPPAPASVPFQITVGDAVLVFPAPPPPYFADPHSPGRNNPGFRLQNGENPPSYSSIFDGRLSVNSPDRTEATSPESVYTISMTNPSEVVPSPYYASDPPPKYEEKVESANLPTPPSPNPPSSAPPPPLRTEI
ncbi:transmembrane protein 171 [Lissotriton helveticus]